MKQFILGIIIIISYVLQLTLLPEFSFFGVQANLLLVITCSIAFLFGAVEGSIVGLIFGLLIDLYQGKSIGLSAIIFFYLGVFIGGFNKKFFKDNYLILLILIVLSTLVYEVLIYIFYIVIYSQSFMFLPLIRNLFLGIVMNIIMAVIVYPVLMKFNIGFEAKRNIFR